MSKKLDIEKMRTASHLLPDPGGEVVRECLDEIARLRRICGWASNCFRNRLDHSSEEEETLNRTANGEVIEGHFST